MAVGALNEVLSSVFLIALLFLLGPGFGSGPVDLSAVPPVAWAALAVSTLFYTLFAFLTYNANQTVEAGERSVINQLQLGWILLLAWLLLGETPGLVPLAGVGLIVAGACLCVWHPGHWRWETPGVRLTALAALAVGTAGVADKVGLAHIPPLIYALSVYLIPAAVGVFFSGRPESLPSKRGAAASHPFSLRRAHSRMADVWRHHGPWMAAFAVLNVLPFIAYFMALRHLPIGVAAPLMNTNVVLTALGGAILLGEGKEWPRKIAGALLAFLGAALVGG